MEGNKDYAEFGSQVGYVIGANVILFLLGIVTIPILTKGLGATLYGTWALISVTISLIVPVALLGLSQSLVRFLAAEKDKAEIRENFFSSYAIIFISGLVFALILFALSSWLATSVFHDAESSIYIRLASVLILFNCLNNLSIAFFRTFRKIKTFAIITVSRNAVEIGLILLFIVLGYKLTGVIAATIVAGVSFAVITLVIILKQIGFQLPKFSNLKSYLKFGIPLAPSVVLAWIIQFSDRYMVSYFMGVTATGIYSAAYGLGNYASFFVGPLGVVLLPTIAKFYSKGNLDETKNYLSHSLKYLMMIAIPSAFGLSVLARPILQILTTPEFVPGNIIVPFVAFAAVSYGFYYITVYIIYLVKKTTVTLGLLSASAVLNIGLNLILIPRMGILGAAIATLIAYGILGILTLIVTRRYLKFNLNVPFMLKSVFSSAIMTLCIWLLHPESIASVIISIFAGAAIYFAVLLAIKGLSKGEITFFVGFLKANLSKIRVRK